MSSYYYLLIAVPVSVVLIRSLLLRKKNISQELFSKAIKNENDGLFEEALIGYTNALDELNKNGSNNKFKDKIIEKIKVLHTVIDYKKNSRFNTRDMITAKDVNV